MAEEKIIEGEISEVKEGTQELEEVKGCFLTRIGNRFDSWKANRKPWSKKKKIAVGVGVGIGVAAAAAGVVAAMNGGNSSVVEEMLPEPQEPTYLPEPEPMIPNDISEEIPIEI